MAQPGPEAPARPGAQPRHAARSRRLGSVAPGAGVLAVHAGDPERQVEGLAAVEAGVARGLVPVAQVAFGDVLPAAHALGDVVAGELDVDAARVGAERAVHLEEAGDLVQHVIEVAGPVAARPPPPVSARRGPWPRAPPAPRPPPLPPRAP